MTSRPHLQINQSTSSYYDSCVQDFKQMTNNRIYDFHLNPNMQNSRDNREQYIQNTNILGTLESTNYDNNGKFVNIGTTLRNGLMTHDGHRMQLDTRLFPGSPFLAQGQSTLKNPDLASRLLYGQNTRTAKSASSLADASIDNFIPLIPCIQENVQNTQHIIPEYWVRGGQSTRAIIRNIDYIKSCGNKN